MDQEFKNRVNRLPEYLEKLRECTPLNRLNLKTVPTKGVYLFIEDDHPIYVGRTNRMRQRLLEHSRLSSGHNDASFAFKLAKEKARKQGINVDRSRKLLVADDDFKSIFLEERRRVALMGIMHVEIGDSIDQCLFEVYAAEVLKTPYNDFDNH